MARSIFCAHWPNSNTKPKAPVSSRHQSIFPGKALCPKAQRAPPAPMGNTSEAAGRRPSGK
jgi:hypothetical protein